MIGKAKAAFPASDHVVAVMEAAAGQIGETLLEKTFRVLMPTDSTGPAGERSDGDG
jgi:hypothetical protein